MVRVSREWVRVVGTGGSLAGNDGITVRCWVVVDEGFAAVVVAEVAEVVDAGFAGFAAVAVAAAAFGVVAIAVRTAEEEKLQCAVRYAMGAALDDEADKSAEKPLRAGIAAIVVLPQEWPSDAR